MPDISPIHLRLKLITSYSVYNIMQEDTYFAIKFARYKICGNTVLSVVKYNGKSIVWEIYIF